MKRSEMIDLMAETMEEWFDGDNGSWQGNAEKVLDMMEEKGILPPFVERFMHGGNVEQTHEYYKWEKE